EPFASGVAAVALLDCAETSRGHQICVLDRAGKLVLERVTESENMITGEITRRVSSGELPMAAYRSHGTPEGLLIGSGGSSVCVAWRDGSLVRFDTRDLEAPRVAEEVDLVPESGAELTSVRLLLGRATLLAGDSLGRVNAWFCNKPEDAATCDGAVLV